MLLALAPVAVHAATDCLELIVSNEGSGDISIVDPRKLEVTATIPVGTRPRGLALSPGADVLYVALSGTPVGGPGVDESKLPPADKQADGIGVIDLDARRLLRVIRGVSDPERLALSADGLRLYVASEDQGRLVGFDLQRGVIVSRIPVGAEAEGVDFSPDGRQIFVTSEAENLVSVLASDGVHGVAKIPVGVRPRSTAFSLDGRFAYVANEASASISVIDRNAMRVSHELKMPLEGLLPMRVLVSRDGRTLYASTGRGRAVIALDASSGQMRGNAEAGARPWGLAMSPDGQELYSANGPSNDVAIIAAPQMNLRGKVTVGQKPWDVMCRPPSSG
jgi:YVTN family beta-propeller protein